MMPLDQRTFEYAKCPACGGVTPHGYANRLPGQKRALPVEAACLVCQTWTTFVDPTALVSELDASGVHPTCGTSVRCPATAIIVRCPARTHLHPPGATDEERMAIRLFPGPAATT